MAEPTSDIPRSDTLCEHCSSLSFDDHAIGGREVSGADGVARLFFPESKIVHEPTNWQSKQDNQPDYRMVCIDWKLDDTLPDMPLLSHSSQLGCQFCQALRRSLKIAFARDAELYPIITGALNLVAYLALCDEVVEGLVVEANFIRGSGYECKDSTHTIFPIEGDSSELYHTIKLRDVYANHSSEECGRWLGTQPARDASYLDPTNIEKIRRLLDYCTSECQDDIPSSFMPTRLIDIGHNASVVPRLVFSSSIRKTRRTKYAALSYCWGNARDAESQFKTEKASLEPRCAGLPSKLMTPTTTDAITFARALGLRYLWIDALCIIQDDKDDWLRESSQMNLVYRHAFVTFCSLNSDSCHDGFLERAPAIKIPFHSTIRKAIKGCYFIRLRPRTGLGVNRNRHAWNFALSKWSKRCWTFQEHEMSTRLLFFGSLNMQFACARCQWFEGDEAPRDRPESTSGVSDKITRFKDGCISSKELYEYWDLLVHKYGHRSVTFDRDRLPAIAGLARMLGEVLQDQYLAGIWKNDLHCGLAWGSVHHHDSLSRGLEAHIRNIRERNYVAPSWSWAACSAVASLRRQGAVIVEESNIVDVDTDTVSGDQYGQVSRGFLRIRGKVAQMPDWLVDPLGTLWLNCCFHYTEANTGFVYINTDWRQKDYEEALALLVVILLHRIEHKDGAKAPSLRALLLYPADGSNHYYRVGVVESEGHNAYRAMRGWFKDSQEETICII